VVYRLLLLLGLSVDRLPSAEAILYSVIIASIALLSYSLQSRRRKHLAKELAAARAELHYLQEKLLEEPRRKNKEIRIFMDGAFDMLHFGHMNAFRLARSLGTRLVVGVNSDLSIAACKGSPLMSDDERISMVSGCKFVDEIVRDCPYIMNKEYLEWVIEKYNIDYVVHGS
jgi:ethanolamine-phosphate cytidylyltransferase